MFGLYGCGSATPTDIGLTEGRLSPCPSSPNCVTSDTQDVDHMIEPLRLSADAGLAWDMLKNIVAGLPRTAIVVDDDTYLHAEAKSRIFGFIDDVEFHLRPEEALIAVRSAARTGHSDFGVNAERIEIIRNELQAKNLLR